ncbi:MAG: zinc ABC transporter substrate-binding protein [Patescibacteria group bacterium]
MNKKIIIGFVLGIIFIGILTLVIKNKHSALSVSSDKIQVSTSFYPLYFFTSEIGADKANVSNITPAGGEPHDYEPTPNDIASIENSNLLILNGGGLEAWGGDVKKNLETGNNKTVIVTAGENLTNQTVLEDGKTITDPHVWLAPTLASIMVDKILAGFIQADAVNKNYYETNAEKLKMELSALDTEYKNGLVNCISKNIVTSHSAFGYLSTVYNLHQVPISGLSPDSEPSPKQIADVADFAKKNNVKYIFFESLVSPKLSETVAREIGAQTLVLDPIEGISPENISKGENYFTVMRENLKNLEIALECK